MADDKKMKVKKGTLAVLIGQGDQNLQKFVIPITHLYHPLFENLLEKAHELYGYQRVGPLRLPCSVDEFLHLKWMVEREGNYRRHQRVCTTQHQKHNHQFYRSLSFNSC